MVAKFALFKITNGTGTTATKFYFRGIAGSYDGIATACGVVEVTDSDEKKMPACSVEELLGSSQAERVKLRLAKAANKSEYKEIIVATDKADTVKKAKADGGLIGETFGGRAILSVVSPRRASYR
jgi:hypothetical protein